jgi:hypothetical protein
MFKRTIEGLLVMLMICRSAFAIPVGIDNFEDGTTQGWFVPGPHPAPPTKYLDWWASGCRRQLFAGECAWW